MCGKNVDCDNRRCKGGILNATGVQPCKLVKKKQKQTNKKKSTDLKLWPIHGHSCTIDVGPPPQIFLTICAVDLLIELSVDFSKPNIHKKKKKKKTFRKETEKIRQKNKFFCIILNQFSKNGFTLKRKKQKKNTTTTTKKQNDICLITV